MDQYSMKTNKRGVQMYYKNNKLVAFKDIPEFTAILDKDYTPPAEPPKSALEAVNDGLNSDVFIEGYAPPKPVRIPLERVDQPTVQTDTVKPMQTDVHVDTKVCLVCEEASEFQRFVNLQTVGLCKDHYHSLTLGEIVQSLRERHG